MCLRLKCPRNVMYCPLASSLHAGTEADRERKQAEQPWVSQSQPPASCWNQRNHKNVTASVIIPPCCLAAWWPAPENSSEAACFSHSHTCTHTHAHTVLFSCSPCPLVLIPHTHTQIHTRWFLSGYGCPFCLLFSAHTDTVYKLIHTHTGPDKITQPAICFSLWGSLQTIDKSRHRTPTEKPIWCTVHN